MNKSMGISAVVITLNEEKNIERCLASLEGVVDEIVVLDSFSEDKTYELASKYTDNVIRKEWEGYAASKNFANSQAHHEYILSIDADEVLSPELKASILQAKSAGLAGAYKFNRLTNYCGTWIRHAGWYPDTKLRLFPKSTAHWEGDHVHEVLVLTPSSLKQEKLEGDLLHYSYYSEEEHISREMKYARLAAQRDINTASSKLMSFLSYCFKFFKMYVLKRGFLHGRIGLQLCRIAAMSKRWKYQATLQLQKKD